MRRQTVYELALSAMITTVLLTGAVFSPRAATAATYYVATTGTDANPGTQEQPFQTIARGLTVLRAGDALYLRGGTYVESISTNSKGIPSGTSWSNAITIAGYPGETVTLLPTEGGVLILNAYNNWAVDSIRYLIFDNLVLDAAGAPGGISVYGNADHISIQNSEVKNATSHGIYGGAGATDIAFINLKVHNNGSNGSHGFYLAIPYALIEGCDIYNNGGYGIQIFGGPTDNTTIRNNQVHDNWRNGGVTLNHGNNILFYNNLVYNNGGNGVAVSFGTLTNTQIDSNIIHNNNGYGIAISTNSVGAIIQNNILYQNYIDIGDWGAGTILIENLTTAP